MSQVSAGFVLVRRVDDHAEVLIVHPGGPFWADKDEGAWTIPKGLVEPGEDLLAAAVRETTEELGTAPEPPFAPLGEVRMKSGKRVVAWAARSELDATAIRSNEIVIAWPPRSGRELRIPEVDRAVWSRLHGARRLANPALVPLLERATDDAVMHLLFGAGPARLQ